MSYGRGSKRFLTKAGRQHGIITNQIRQDDLYRMSSFEEDVASLKNNAHAALAQAPFQEIPAVKRSVA
jgi:hypothetical protein